MYGAPEDGADTFIFQRGFLSRRKIDVPIPTEYRDRIAFLGRNLMPCTKAAFVSMLLMVRELVESWLLSTQRSRALRDQEVVQDPNT